ncbi:hypothetical protein C8R46DRAFT_1303353 [Mycena filopes]|nr:hypothetical protein C8R46DRAFT_1303353 [Mycena filopes]
MKTSALFTLASVVSSVIAACDPPTARISLAKKGLNPNGNVGAAYFMSNEPSGNYLISSLIGKDGKLSLYEGLYTSGTGLKGVPGPPVNVLDALFTQGLHRRIPARPIPRQRQRMLVQIRSRSSPSIQQNPAKLTPIGKPVWSGGEFPTAVAITKAGDRLCVVNGGAISGVSCYNVDTRKGLTPIRNGLRDLHLNQTTPATGPGNTPGDIIFSADEKQLIVSIKTGTGYLAIWDVNHDGSLSRTFSKVTGGVLPFSLTKIPGTTGAILSSDPGIGYSIYNLDGNKAKSPAVSTKIPGQIAVCWTVFSPASGNYYMTDIMTSQITEVHIEKSLQSHIVKQYDQGIDGPMDATIVTIGKKDFMYTLAANVTGVTVFTVDGPGNLNVFQRLDVANPAAAANITLNRLDVQGMAVFLH